VVFFNSLELILALLANKILTLGSTRSFRVFEDAKLKTLFPSGFWDRGEYVKQILQKFLLIVDFCIMRS